MQYNFFLFFISFSLLSWKQIKAFFNSLMKRICIIFFSLLYFSKWTFSSSFPAFFSSFVSASFTLANLKNFLLYIRMVSFRLICRIECFIFFLFRKPLLLIPRCHLFTLSMVVNRRKKEAKNRLLVGWGSKKRSVIKCLAF